MHDLYSSYMNGIINISRKKDNYFDLMKKQKIISSSDYILKGKTETEVIDYGPFKETRTYYNIDVSYNLESRTEFQKYPSNDLVKNSDEYEIKVYGIYMNGMDVTDKLKYKVISFDNIEP